VACDLDVSSLSSRVEPSDLISLTREWEIPEGEWPAVLLLDVLEHHPSPRSFIGELSPDLLVLKVPMASGPLGILGKGLARIGVHSLLEALFVADDVSPHFWLPSRRGLGGLAHSLGYDVVSRIVLPEVATELPERIRFAELRQWQKLPLRILGLILGGLGHFWSDTEVWLLRRSVSAS
jgi:hypothetical protein